MQNAEMDEPQAGIKMVGRNINNLRYTADITLMAERKEEVKSLLIRVKEESEKTGLKLNIQKTKIMTSSHITSWQIDGEKVEMVVDSIFLGSRTTMDSDCLHKIKRCLFLGRKVMTNLCIKKQRHHFADRSPYSQSCGFASSHVQMWELDHKEVWALKNWCFQTVVQEQTLESPLDGKEIKPVNSTGNRPWIFIGRTDAGAKTPILWPLDAKNWLIEKDPGSGKDWRREEKGTTEDEMVGWHHRLDGHEFEQALGDGEGQGSLVCCSPWFCKELDGTEQLNNNSRFILLNSRNKHNTTQ